MSEKTYTFAEAFELCRERLELQVAELRPTLHRMCAESGGRIDREAFEKTLKEMEQILRNQFAQQARDIGYRGDGTALPRH